MSEQDETTAEPYQTLHVHLWKAAHHQKGTDDDLLMDVDVEPTGYYGDHTQYSLKWYGGQTLEIRRPYAQRGDDHALYERYTYAPAARLQALREDAPLTEQDVLNLYATFCDGSASAGVDPTMIDFGKWLSGTDEYDEIEPAEVVW